MRVQRIIPNIPVRDTAAANQFYADALGLNIDGDFGWVGFLTAPGRAGVELHTVTRDESAPVDSVMSIGVDDVDAACRRVEEAGAEIVYPLTDEPWGVRRFFFRDPDGNVVSVVAHRWRSVRRSRKCSRSRQGLLCSVQLRRDRPMRRVQPHPGGARRGGLDIGRHRRPERPESQWGRRSGPSASRHG